MPIIIKNSGGGYFQISPEGQFAAICVKVMDLGTQYNQNYNNWQRKGVIAWELHGDNQIGEGNSLMESGKPFVHMEWFTFSLSPKSNLTGVLESWRGKSFTKEELDGFDISKLLGAPCMLTIQHNVGDNGKTYANVTSITPLLKSIAKPSQINPSIMFCMEPWDDGAFQGLDKFWKEKVSKSREYMQMTGQMPIDTVTGPAHANDVPFDDEIPF